MNWPGFPQAPDFRPTKHAGTTEKTSSGEGRPELWIVNTLFSCLRRPCVVQFCPTLASAVRVRPEAGGPLSSNGRAVADGKPRYVTALAETDSAQGCVLREGGQRLRDRRSQQPKRFAAA